MKHVNEIQKHRTGTDGESILYHIHSTVLFINSIYNSNKIKKTVSNFVNNSTLLCMYVQNYFMLHVFNSLQFYTEV